MCDQIGLVSFDTVANISLMIRLLLLETHATHDMRCTWEKNQ